MKAIEGSKVDWYIHKAGESSVNPNAVDRLTLCDIVGVKLERVRPVAPKKLTYKEQLKLNKARSESSRELAVKYSGRVSDEVAPTIKQKRAYNPNPFRDFTRYY